MLGMGRLRKRGAFALSADSLLATLAVQAKARTCPETTNQRADRLLCGDEYVRQS